MKKVTSLLLVFVFCICLAACDGGQSTLTSSLLMPDASFGSQITQDGQNNSSGSQTTVSNIATGTGSQTTQNTSSGSQTVQNVCVSDKPHTDEDNNGKCDKCSISVVVNFDFFAINDLHGKLGDTDSQPGVDELTTYLKDYQNNQQNVVLLSSGDMWQGSSESNLTKGNIITDWMNELGFVSMTLGNHEYDWGEEYIENNAKLANFPFLAINIYDRSTNKLVDYCQPSTVVEQNGVKIGIIGAMGDCYSSIASERVEDVYFITGSELTSLVKAESQRLRNEGADFIVYSIHDGYSGTNYTETATNSMLASYYDVSLSQEAVDLVFEAHTHKHYVKKDAYGVYHLQNGGDNGGISYVDVDINFANDTANVVNAEYISTNKYSHLDDDPIVDTLLKKYESQISDANQVLGYNASYRTGNNLRNIVARLYYEAGVKKWGKDYDIVLGGGFLSVRSPGKLEVGDVTYADLQMIFPFDNQLVLCSVKGRDLKSKFFESKNSNYFIHYEEYGEGVKNNIEMDKTYYIIVDSYSSTYAPNRLTEIARYDETTFARDLLADYIKSGGLQ